MHILNNMAIERAWKDTKTSFNWKQGVTAFFVFMIGTLIHLKWAPSASETTGEIMLWLTFSVAPVIVLAVASFFYNLFCAPYRVERDAHTATRSRLDDIQQKLSEISPDDSLTIFYANRDNFTLKEAACLLANEPFTAGKVGGLAAGHLSDLQREAYKLAIQLKPSISIVQADLHRLIKTSYGGEIPSLEDSEVSKESLEHYARSKGIKLPFANTL